MQSAYERFRRDGRLPASYEIVFANAWAPPAGTRRDPAPAETRVSVEELTRELRRTKAGRPPQ
jgi:malonyl-CoA O-methyltransferase